MKYNVRPKTYQEWLCERLACSSMLAYQIVKITMITKLCIDSPRASASSFLIGPDSNDVVAKVSACRYGRRIGPGILLGNELSWA